MSIATRLALAGALVLAIVVAGGCAVGLRSDAAKTSSSRTPRPASLPLVFEPNVGQTNARAHFLARSPSHTFFLTGDELVLSRVLPAGQARPSGERRARVKPPVRLDVMRMKLAGARTDTQPSAGKELPGKVNYFIGKDPQRWRKDIPVFNQVRYRSVYPKIDLVYRAEQARVRYEFVLEPGADPDAIRLAFPEARTLALDGAGNLLVVTAGGTIRHTAPRIYQLANARPQVVSGGFTLFGNTAGFKIGAHDATRPLMIDPEIVFASYYGGTLEEGYGQGTPSIPASADAFNAFDIAVDAQGRLLAAGITFSADLPGTGDSAPGNVDPDATPWTRTDAFALRISFADPSAPVLDYAVYFGGSDWDEANGIAAGASGAVYVAGSTQSTDLPRTDGAFAPAWGASPSPDSAPDTFVAKLDASGNLERTTYLSPGWFNRASAIAVDEAGAAGYQPGVYVVGSTSTVETGDMRATTGAFQTVYGGRFDAFAAKLGIDLRTREYLTYLGGQSDDYAFAVAVRGGQAFIAGHTASMDFPVRGAASAQREPGVPAAFRSACVPSLATLDGIPACADGFVTVLNAAGSDAVYSTYLGGPNFDYLRGIAVDSGGSAYVAGVTDTGVADRGYDVLLVKLRPDGSEVYRRTLGGAGDEIGMGIATDADGNAHFTGWTLSGGLATADATQANLTPSSSTPPSTDAFYAIAGADGTFTYFTYFGGSSYDAGYAIARDAQDNVYIGGVTGSGDLAPVHPVAPRAGSADIFLVKFAPVIPSLSIQFTKSCPDTAAIGDQVSCVLQIVNETTRTGTGISVVDALPDHLRLDGVFGEGCTTSQNTVSCPALTVPPGGINIVVRATAISCGTATNTTTLTAPNGQRYTASDTITIDRNCPAAPAFSKTGPATASVGGEVEYLLRVVNPVSPLVTRVTVRDRLPPQLTLLGVSEPACNVELDQGRVTCENLDLPAGADKQIVVRAFVRQCGSIVNTATLSAASLPEVSRSATTTVTCPPPPRGEGEVCTAAGQCESRLTCARTCGLVQECAFSFIICLVPGDSYWVCNIDAQCLPPEEESPAFRRQ